MGTCVYGYLTLFWGSSEEQTREDSWLYSGFWPKHMPALMHTLMHTENSFDTKEFQSLFSVASLQGALPTPSTPLRHVPGWWCGEGAGRLWDTSKRTIQRILSHKSCSTSTFSQGCALYPGSQQKLLSRILLGITPWAQEGIWKEEGATVFHMKHRINRIAQDVEGVKDDEVLLKVKEHLTLPQKTSLRMLSNVNKLHSFFFS